MYYNTCMLLGAFYSFIFLIHLSLLTIIMSECVNTESSFVKAQKHLSGTFILLRSYQITLFAPRKHFSYRAEFEEKSTQLTLSIQIQKNRVENAVSELDKAKSGTTTK